MLTNIIHFLTKIIKFIALSTMALMMIFITIGVVSRLLFTPIVGDIEIVQLGMIILIMGGLAYTQHIDGHISIELIVDKLPIKAQKVFDAIGCLFTLGVALTISFIYLEVTINHKNHMILSTNLLEIPYYPLDFIIFLGFLMWGLESLLKLINSILAIFQPVISESEVKSNVG